MTRCGLVAVLGAPNAGKSTLVNALVGQKVAIVSPKAQTTRTRLLGVAIEGDTQLLLVDTPGIFDPKRRLDRAMVAAAWGVPKIGVALTITLMVAGQLALSLILDHFGVMGVPQQPISLTRIAGVLLVIGGVLLVRRG